MFKNKLGNKLNVWKVVYQQAWLQKGQQLNFGRLTEVKIFFPLLVVNTFAVFNQQTCARQPKLLMIKVNALRKIPVDTCGRNHQMSGLEAARNSHCFKKNHPNRCTRCRTIRTWLQDWKNRIIIIKMLMILRMVLKHVGLTSFAVNFA